MTWFKLRFVIIKFFACFTKFWSNSTSLFCSTIFILPIVRSNTTSLLFFTITTSSMINYWGNIPYIFSNLLFQINKGLSFSNIINSNTPMSITHILVWYWFKPFLSSSIPKFQLYNFIINFNLFDLNITPHCTIQWRIKLIISKLQQHCGLTNITLAKHNNFIFRFDLFILNSFWIQLDSRPHPFFPLNLCRY